MGSFFANISNAFNAPEQHDQSDRFTLAELRRLHEVLTENTSVNESNKDLVVETLRSLAELIIWGDQHDTRFFDYFAEKHLLSHFNRILQQPNNQRGEVPMQVLQTLSILIANIRSETAIFYLFSNNYINDIITTHLDFDDDEIIGYYINLLKAISLKFTNTTVQFFFDTEAGDTDKFPLYTESIKFIGHRDGMVRSAVRALTLNVYSIGDETVQSFVCSEPFVSFFRDLASLVVAQCQRLDAELTSILEGKTTAEHLVEAALAEIEDLLSYFNDIVANGIALIGQILSEALWSKFVGPVLLWPLLKHRTPLPAWAAATRATLSRSPVDDNPPAPPSAAGPPPATTVLPSGEGGVVGSTAALLVLERLVMVVSERSLLRPVLIALLAGGRASVPLSDQGTLPAWASAGAVLRAQQTHSQVGGTDDVHGNISADGGSSMGDFGLPRYAWRVLQLHPSHYREAFLSTLRGGNATAATSAVRVLLALLLCRAMDDSLLDAAGLLPARRRKQRDLLDSLTAPPSPTMAGSLPDRAAMPPTGRLFRMSSNAGSGSLKADVAQPAIRRTQSHISPHDLTTAPEAPSPRTPGSTNIAAHNYLEVLNALCGLVALRDMPVSALWTTAWLLRQLLPHPQPTMTPAVRPSQPTSAAASDGRSSSSSSRDPSCSEGWSERLSAHQRSVLSKAWTAARDLLMDHMGGIWCDALPLLIHTEWGKAVAGLRSPGPQSTVASVAAWVQAHHTVKLLRQGRQAPTSTQAQRHISTSGRAACLLWQAALHFITLTQLHQAITSSTGEVSPTAGLHFLDEPSLRPPEIRANTEVELTSRVVCSVAFSAGVERQVFFAMEGRPNAAEGTAAAVCANPVVLLADQGSRVDQGQVLSVAPLMGANPTIDTNHKRWLHIHVRPTVRGLLKVLRNSVVANTHQNLAHMLVDGHWVLNFPNAEKAHAARDLVDQHQAKLRASYCDALAGLLLPGETF